MQKENLLDIIRKNAEESLSSKQLEELLLELSQHDYNELQKIANNDFDYCELHLHSDKSLLDGAGTVEQYKVRALELGHKALAITDHGVTHNWIPLRTVEKDGVKPIFGSEIYLHDGEEVYHFLLLAKNTIGYQNILKIVTKGHVEKSNTSSSKPNVSKDFVVQHTEGIIATSACIGGPIGKRVLQGKTWQEITDTTVFWLNVFGDDFYLEVQDYEVEDETQLEDFQIEFIEKQRKVNDAIYRLSEQLDIPLIATNDVHYVRPEDNETQDILLCINTKEKLDNPDRFRFQSNLHYMKDKWEMLYRFRKNPSAVFNTQIIADSTDIEYQEKYLLPTYPYLPEGVSALDYFKESVWKGIDKFYSKPENYEPLLEKFQCSLEELWERINKRTEREISVLENMGFEGYMQIVGWVIEVAKEMNALVGPGRGSAAGSIVALALEITQVCPLRYDLLFERFLNPDRLEMPDIDVDFQYEKRGEIIEAIANRLGRDKVAQIVTFGRMMARAALREIGRVMGTVSNGKIDKLAKMIPFQTTIAETLELVPEFKEEYEKDVEVKRLIDNALKIEGMPKNYSVHAAGVILSSEPITNHTAFQTGKKAMLPVIQAEMNYVDTARLVKQDFLGLRTLSVKAYTLELIEKRYGISIDPYKIPLDDKKTYELLASGNTIACFQLESKGMRQLLHDIHTEQLEDVVDCIALYRPGVLKVGMHHEYVKNKFKPDDIHYIHPKLKPILSPSRGIMIYQEQAMLIANQLAGFSMADADKLRKAIGKKKKELMAKLKVQFVEGCQTTSGLRKETATEIWDLIEVMASYSFNKSHSVAYAFMSVETAYLKANYPLEFMTAAIAKAAEAKSPKVPLYIEEARRMGIVVTPPDVNLSNVDFDISDDKIVFGLRAIRDVGKASAVIVEDRNINGPFKNIVDFRERLPKVNKKVITALIRAGAFDSLGINRNALLSKLDDILAIKPKKKEAKNTKQISLFPDFESLERTSIVFPEIDGPNEEDIAELEDEMLGIYITHHPLTPHKEEMDKITTANADELDNFEEDQLVIVGGLIKEKKVLYTKRDQSEMAKYSIDDLTGLIDVISFPRQYQKMKEIKEKDIVLIKGRINFNEKMTFNDEDGESGEKEYDIQIVAEEMVIYSTETAEMMQQLSLSQIPQYNTPIHIHPNKITLEDYLQQQGNPKVIIL